ncbi:hypothetical protein CC1G_02776 [Coprinopsis cinerea okayama7|uniref:Uncharacterized protein n=1 Tax=Coprinopsis cinerea (strain Okayama-7 / 130 / ATCC MYA-4618 / FGSC 9003) TaxID=240176 RepID=A8N006_COPC7|nr:hypothetical protein CC1G_02776 [Coprinopsis cinerea okayama7\|eukprot:XP_001828195.2 hypothetical protein CC1G_02776 [Coprinopsis cinerea okayama7\
MVKLASVAFITAALVASASAAPQPQGPRTAGASGGNNPPNPEIFGIIASGIKKGYDKVKKPRDFGEEEVMYVRELLEDLYGREFWEEVYERSPPASSSSSGGGIGRAPPMDIGRPPSPVRRVPHVQGAKGLTQVPRDLGLDSEVMYQRSPSIGKGGRVKPLINRPRDVGDSDMYGRDFLEELYERDPQGPASWAYYAAKGWY